MTSRRKAKKIASKLDAETLKKFGTIMGKAMVFIEAAKRMKAIPLEGIAYAQRVDEYERKRRLPKIMSEAIVSPPPGETLPEEK